MNFSKNFNPDYSKKLTKKDLQKVFFRSIPLEAPWNYERMANVGFAFAIMPALKKLYPDPKDFAQAMKRELGLYNITPYISTFPMGITLAMEEENALNPDFDTESITNVKTALMGPLSGIGDAFFWGTLRILATGIGTSLAIKGNILGPILFFLTFNIPHYIIRYFGTFLGYGLGTDVMTEIQESGLMDKLTKYASIVGMMVVGAMTMDMVKVNFITKIGIGKSGQTIQQLLDGVIPGIATLGIFGIMCWLLKKKVNPMLIMLVILVLSIGAAYFKILG